MFLGHFNTDALRLVFVQLEDDAAQFLFADLEDCCLIATAILSHATGHRCLDSRFRGFNVVPLLLVTQYRQKLTVRGNNCAGRQTWELDLIKAGNIDALKFKSTEPIR